MINAAAIYCYDVVIRPQKLWHCGHDGSHKPQFENLIGLRVSIN